MAPATATCEPALPTMTARNVTANGKSGRHGDAPVVVLADGEQRDERPEALVDHLTLDEGGVERGRRQRDDEDGDRPPPPDDQRECLEQEERDAERVARAGVGRAAREREKGQGRQPEGDRGIDQPRKPGTGCARSVSSPAQRRGSDGCRHHAQGSSRPRPRDEATARQTGVVSPEFLLTTFIVIASPGTGVIHTLAAGLSRGSARCRSTGRRCSRQRLADAIWRSSARWPVEASSFSMIDRMFPNGSLNQATAMPPPRKMPF